MAPRPPGSDPRALKAGVPVRWPIPSDDAAGFFSWPRDGATTARNTPMTFNFGRFWQQLRQGVLGRRGAHRRARPRRFLARLLLENLEDRTVPSSVQFGLFDTGVNSSATGLADAAVDPHYTLVASADPNSPGPNAFVVNQDGFPVGNPWLADTATSKWIAPQAEQNTSTFPATAGNAGGNYDYQTTFDLGTANPSQVTLSGTLASDDTDTDILINGTSTGFTNSSASPSTFRPSRGSPSAAVLSRA